MRRGIKHILFILTFLVSFNLYNKVSAINLENTCIMEFEEKMQVVVKFETNGGEYLNDLNYCRGCNTKKFKLPTPVRKGYIFKGWYADSKLNQEVGTVYDKVNTEKIATLYPYSLGCNIKKAYVYLYAKWEKDDKCDIPTSYKVNIKYQTNSDDKFDNLKFTMGEDNNNITLPTPKKDGYYFIGWYGDSNYRTLVDKDVLTPEELYIYIKTSYKDDKACSFDKEGTLYAKYVNKDELISMVTDYADNNFYMVKDIIK